MEKKSLRDYFFNPIETHKSKIGLFSLLSIDSRRIGESTGVFIPESKDDFLDLYDEFNFIQNAASIGLGATATLFVWNFYISSAISGGDGIYLNTTEYSGGVEKNSTWKFSLMQFRINFGYQGKRLKLEYAARVDTDASSILNKYDIVYGYFMQSVGMHFRFPTKEEKLKL